MSETKFEQINEDPGAFVNFPISEKTVEILKKRGFTQLFPIQYNTFKVIYNGSDMVGRDQTGSGKTVAYILPTVEKIRSLNLFSSR